MREFQVGDQCRIREWDDMAEEFGYNHLGEIDCEAVFTKEMRSLCGKQFTVSNVEHNYGVVRYRSIEKTENNGGRWMISADMLEYDADESDSFDLISSDIMSFLMPA